DYFIDETRPTYKWAKWLLNIHGDTLLPFSFDYISATDNYYIVRDSNSFESLYNKSLKQILPFNYYEIWEEKNGLIQVKDKNLKINFLNRNLQPLLKENVDDAERFSDGLIAVKKNSLWGFIDSTAQLVIPFQYKSTYGGTFINGICEIEDDGVQCFINKKGEKLSCNKYCSIRSLSLNDNSINDNFYRVNIAGGSDCNSNKIGIVDCNLKELIPCLYDDIEMIYGINFFKVINGRYCAYFNSSGKQLTEFVYDY
ncbi:MAG: hypothetical protein RI955_995, partial [Bacteroidota bacterium]